MNSAGTFNELTGPAGPARLVTALQEQFLAGGDAQVANALARFIKLKGFSPGEELIVQGAPDDDLMFILGGSVSVLVNGREVARRTVGHHIGDICLLDTTALRSATVRAVEPTVVGTLSVEAFTQIAQAHPDLWRRTELVNFTHSGW